MPLLQMVEMVLGIDAATHLYLDEIHTRIQQHIRKTCGIALDLVFFDECIQKVDELFDDFYISYSRIYRSMHELLRRSDEDAYPHWCQGSRGS